MARSLTFSLLLSFAVSVFGQAMGGLTRLSLVFLEDLLVDIGSVGLFSSVEKARLSFGAENWSSDQSHLFVCPVSFPCHLGVGSNPDEYRCNGGS